jgi:hypothetical protein
VGKGLLSPFYKILAKQPKFVFLHRNKQVLNTLKECHIFLHESISTPTKCNTLITAWPDYVGIKDASKQGVGGIIMGEEQNSTTNSFPYAMARQTECGLPSKPNQHYYELRFRDGRPYAFVAGDGGHLPITDQGSYCPL